MDKLFERYAVRLDLISKGLDQNRKVEARDSIAIEEGGST
jgi:hypothetical protein